MPRRLALEGEAAVEEDLAAAHLAAGGPVVHRGVAPARPNGSGWAPMAMAAIAFVYGISFGAYRRRNGAGLVTPGVIFVFRLLRVT